VCGRVQGVCLYTYGGFSRSSKHRCNTLITLIEKENQELEERKEKERLKRNKGPKIKFVSPVSLM